MSLLKLRNLPGIVAALCLIVMPLQAQAKPVKAEATQPTKERLVLMPLRLGEEDKSRQAAMEIALLEGLQQKYEVFSGEQVAKKAREIFLKESKNTAHKECDETRCLQNIAEAFQAELLAIASVSKQDDGYFLALSIQNIFDNKVVYSKSVPCKGCDAYQMVDRLKELGGVLVASQALITSIKSELPMLEPEMVRIPGKNFEISKYEVTQAEWRAVMGNNPSNFSHCGDKCPVENISRDDANEYVQQLSAKSGKQYRLPMVDEWQYACLGGGSYKYCGSNDAGAVGWWGDARVNHQTHPVGKKKANAFGLYDMTGNVWEWTQDCWNGYGGCDSGHVLKGGSWSSWDTDLMRSEKFRVEHPESRRNEFGIRVARTLP